MEACSGLPERVRSMEGLGVMDAEQVVARKLELLAQEADATPVSWWMSFCDLDKPKGEQFIGVAIVVAPGFMHAHQRAWSLGINPGGQIQAYQVEGVGVQYHDRLLSRAELEAAGLV